MDWLLWDAISEIYEATQPVVLPYLFPFGQAHCLCCKWGYPHSSARAVLPSFRTTFTTYFTTGDSIADSDLRYFVSGNDWHPISLLKSSVFTIQPGWKSIWCSLITEYDSRLLQYMLFLNPPSRHTNYVQCKQALLIINGCRS
jgi:hypothetical protein